MCGIETKCRKRGKDIKAFDSEEQDLIYIDADSPLEEQNKRSSQFILNKHPFSCPSDVLSAYLTPYISPFAFQDYLTEQKDQIRLITQLVLTAGFVAIVIAACVLNFNRALVLLVISLVTVFFLVWDWMMECYGDREELSPIRDLLSRNWFWIRWIVCVLLLVSVVEATHLLSASVMSAPASLAIAKIFWPESNR
ncbi:Solute carrier family 28 member 3 [Dissostichus eleginoides]|uniref:Solute carrier family 28 member 3 n=1 Tax=Dissostichus eleginoides TaxID=100907 RepID=A0AAD9C0H0_DISEL|nr:Solute carrier family 28 member 3 [Dissostichus eleginoides]